MLQPWSAYHAAGRRWAALSCRAKSNGWPSERHPPVTCIYCMVMQPITYLRLPYSRALGRIVPDAVADPVTASAAFPPPLQVPWWVQATSPRRYRSCNGSGRLPGGTTGPGTLPDGSAGLSWALGSLSETPAGLPSRRGRPRWRCSSAAPAPRAMPVHLQYVS